MAQRVKYADMAERLIGTRRNGQRPKGILGIEAVPDHMEFVSPLGILAAPLVGDRVGYGDHRIGVLENPSLQRRVVGSCPTAAAVRVSQDGVAKIGNPFDAMALLEPESGQVSGCWRRGGQQRGNGEAGDQVRT